MARTRNASGPAGPSRNSEPPSRRAMLARRSKPKHLYLNDSDNATDSADADDSDVSLQSEASDDDVDLGTDRAINDIEIQAVRPQASSSKSRGRGRPPKAASRSSKTSTNKTTPRKLSKQASTATKRGRSQGKLSSRSPNKKAKTGPKAISPEPNPGVIPNWLDPAIPYSAWLDIFYYAAVAGGTLDNSWLVHTARICKAFAEPALTILYRSPSPTTPIKAKKLVSLLEQPTTETLLNYRAKVESIYIDIDKFPLSHLLQLIQPLRRLKELIIFTPLDQPPYRELTKTIRWHYPEEIFQALSPLPEVEEPNSRPIVLKSWEWSSRLLGGHVADFDDISTIHQMPSFVHLTKLSFTNFQIPSLAKPMPKDEEALQAMNDEDGRAIDTIAAAIARLESLKHLVFESSTIVNDRLLPQLPTTLLNLELINCWDVKTEEFAPFLSTHGHNLLSLTLSHNQSLDLSFLTDLAMTCPKLRQLHMNLSYYRYNDAVADVEPFYDQALLPDQLPLWPSSLIVLEIEHVRHWSVEAAEMFLQSLVNSAPNLPNLRHIAIKTMLNIPWQKRAEMRRGWGEKLEHVFLRPWQAPKPHTTLRPHEDDNVAPVTSVKKCKRPAPSPPSRRSGRIAAHSSDSDRKSSRTRRSGRPTYRDPDTDEDQVELSDDPSSSDDPDRGEPEEEDPMKKLPVQGMCETLSIMFDNQKVRELQYGMEDFNDEDDESSGEEWDGDFEEEDEHVFVWR